MKLIDDFLNNITIYRLVLYYLILLILAAYFLALFKLLSFTPLSLIYSTVTLTVICYIANVIFAKVFKVTTNIESFFITALILALIITPPKLFNDLPFLFWAATLSIASKYILAINKKHVFNPAGFAVALTALSINQSASWWVGNIVMLPFVFIGGFLVVRKIRRFIMVITFFAISLITIFSFSVFNGKDVLVILREVVFYSPIMFFAFVMFTEPLTTPPSQKLRIIYAALVGFLFAPQIHFGSFYSTPETALLLGNIYSYIVSPKRRLVLKLKEKILIAKDTYDFIFTTDHKLSFLPGQYMEWTLKTNNTDSRGNRRYFTISSTPTETDLRLGVKFYEKSSSFKKALMSMKHGSEITASHLEGDFVLPKDPNIKLVFIAGGIGITPFISMIKYLLYTDKKRQITIIYSNKTQSDIAYGGILNQTAQQLGVKVIYILTDSINVPPDWKGLRGYVDEGVIKREVPDFMERTFYLSGPHSMVNVFENVLKNMRVCKKQIKTDFFPGYV